MRRLRALAIMMTGAGLIAGVPVRDAQACDDDRYPCPVREQAAAQETATAPANPAPSTQPKKKANHTRADAKASAKGEREAPSATARANVSKPAVQEQAGDPISQKAAEAAPAAVPSSPANPSRNDESQGESLVATAGTAWPVSPSTESFGDTAGETAANAAEAASNVVQVIDPNQTNDVDRVAAATVEWSWIAYLLLVLGAALAAASATIWFLSGMRSLSRKNQLPAN